jgi:hypothetical protein
MAGYLNTQLQKLKYANYIEMEKSLKTIIHKPCVRLPKQV